MKTLKIIFIAGVLALLTACATVNSTQSYLQRHEVNPGVGVRFW